MCLPLESVCYLLTVHTVPDPYGDDMKRIVSRGVHVALKFTIRLDNLVTSNYRSSGNRIYDRQLTKLDVVTRRIRYRVNEV